MQVYDEYDEEVQDAEAAEEAADGGAAAEERDAELRPFVNRYLESVTMI